MLIVETRGRLWLRVELSGGAAETKRPTTTKTTANENRQQKNLDSHVRCSDLLARHIVVDQLGRRSYSPAQIENGYQTLATLRFLPR